MLVIHSKKTYIGMSEYFVTDKILCYFFLKSRIKKEGKKENKKKRKTKQNTLLVGIVFPLVDKLLLS